MQTKISSSDAASLLTQAGAALRKVTQERDEALAKIAQFSHDQRVVKIATEMQEKGLSPELTLEEKVAAVNRSQNLDVTEEAVKLAAPQSKLLGTLDDAPGGANSLSAFEHYIATGEDPSSED